MTGRAYRLAVIGNPVAHSRSPEIHAAFGVQTGVALTYDRILGADAKADINTYFASGGDGLNVTVPFKADACALCVTLTDVARQTGVVNTLWPVDGGLAGDSTDGRGLVRDMRDNLRWRLTGSRILVIGAGGAARGVIPDLLLEQPAKVVVANRTVARARDIADAWSGRVTATALDAPGSGFDIVINATSAGLAGDVPDVPGNVFEGSPACYDMVYGAAETAFQTHARKAGGGATADGLGMLVEQAAVAFQRWTGEAPDTAPVIEQLRGSLRA